MNQEASLIVEQLRESIPTDLREAGWEVAVHNDYRLNGLSHTFWLFTKNGRAVKGEGRTDRDALNEVRKVVFQDVQDKPSTSSRSPVFLACAEGKVLTLYRAGERFATVVTRSPEQAIRFMGVYSGHPFASEQEVQLALQQFP